MKPYRLCALVALSGCTLIDPTGPNTSEVATPCEFPIVRTEPPRNTTTGDTLPDGPVKDSYPRVVIEIGCRHVSAGSAASTNPVTFKP